MKKSKFLMGTAMFAGLATAAFAGGAKDGDTVRRAVLKPVNGVVSEAHSIPANKTEADVKAGEIRVISNKILEHFRSAAARPGRAQKIVQVQERLQRAVLAMHPGDVRRAIDDMVGDMSHFDLEFEPHKPEWRPEMEVNGQIFEHRAQTYYSTVFNGAVNGYDNLRSGEFRQNAIRLGKIERDNGHESTLPVRAEYDMEYARDILEVRLKNEMPQLGTPRQTGEREFDDMFIDLIKAAAEFNRIVMENNYYKAQDTHVTYEPIEPEPTR